MKKSLGLGGFSYANAAWVVGTYGSDGRPNVATVALGGICCLRPLCAYVSLRQATYTHGNIVQRRAYTVSVPSARYVKETDYFGLVSGRETDKFAATGLTPVKASLVDAPYVAEFPVVLECALSHTIELGWHTQFVGEILDVKAEETVLDENEAVDVTKAQPFVCYAGTSSYHAVGEFLGRHFAIGKDIG